MTVIDPMTVGLTYMSSLLAQDEPGRTGPDFGKASPVGLIIVVLLLIGTFLLVWSMNRHLRRLPKSFDNDDTGPERSDPPAAADPGTATDSPAEETRRESG